VVAPHSTGELPFLKSSTLSLLQAVEEVLQAGASTGDALLRLQARCVLQLDELAEAVRGNLTELQRKALVTLITADVAHRDVVGRLADAGSTNAAQCDWALTYRFEYDAEAGAVTMRQLATRCASRMTACTLRYEKT
jgi:hypothetical protein